MVRLADGHVAQGADGNAAWLAPLVVHQPGGQLLCCVGAAPAEVAPPHSGAAQERGGCVTLVHKFRATCLLPLQARATP